MERSLSHVGQLEDVLLGSADLDSAVAVVARITLEMLGRGNMLRRGASVRAPFCSQGETLMFGQWKTMLLAITSALLLLPGICTAQAGQCAAVIPSNPLPDLIVDPLRLSLDVLVTREKFAANDCAVVEGCVSRKGTHQLQRFTSSTPNVGKGDLVIGVPSNVQTFFIKASATITFISSSMPIIGCGRMRV
jgi:hypothetical protein